MRVRHRHELEALAQALQGLHRVGKRGPLGHRIAKALGQRIGIGQPKLLRDDVPARHEVIGVPLRLAALAGCAIRREERIVRHRAVGHGAAQIGEHAALEIDQRPDDVESQHLEIPKGHEMLLND